jgi:DNA-binding transcriptional LysR family regulator
MNLADLHIFVTVARTTSLALAARECHQTASALSKALRRLETNIRTPLFDRSNKQLVLNRAGQTLLPRAIQLLQFAEQTKSELLGASARVHCRIAAPALLLWRFGSHFSQLVKSAYPDSALSLKPMFEDDALAALANGAVDFACVSSAVIATSNKHWQAHWQADALGSMTMLLTASKKHPLSTRRRALSTAEILRYDFVCPSRSMICGVSRGSHSDGWRDDQLPRQIRYWVDDLHVLIDLVQSGVALAYLPEFAHTDVELIRLEVADCPYSCSEQLYLVHAPSQASGWQRRLCAEFLRAS